MARTSFAHGLARRARVSGAAAAPDLLRTEEPAEQRTDRAIALEPEDERTRTPLRRPPTARRAHRVQRIGRSQCDRLKGVTLGRHRASRHIDTPRRRSWFPTARPAGVSSNTTRSSDRSRPHIGWVWTRLRHVVTVDRGTRQLQAMHRVHQHRMKDERPGPGGRRRCHSTARPVDGRREVVRGRTGDRAGSVAGCRCRIPSRTSSRATAHLGACPARRRGTTRATAADWRSSTARAPPE